MQVHASPAPSCPPHWLAASTQLSLDRAWLRPNALLCHNKGSRHPAASHSAQQRGPEGFSPRHPVPHRDAAGPQLEYKALSH